MKKTKLAILTGTIYFFLYSIPFLIKGNKLDLYKVYIKGMKDGFKARI
jgi:hypothetical protein